MELVSGTVSAKQMLEEVDFITGLLRHHGARAVVIEHGWGSELPPERLWHQHQVTIDTVPEFVRDSMNSGVFTPGKADLIMRSAQPAAAIKFCHESDIHAQTDVPDLIAEIMQHWQALQYDGYLRESDQDTWVRVGGTAC
jgi:hypothetical protein